MKKKFLIITVLATLFVPLAAALAADLQFIAPLPGSKDATIPKNIPVYFRQLYIFGFYLAIILAVLMIVWGGIEYAVSGAIDRKADAKQRIISALLGLALLLGSVFILNIINPNLTRFQIRLPTIQEAQQQAQQ